MIILVVMKFDFLLLQQMKMFSGSLARMNDFAALCWVQGQTAATVESSLVLSWSLAFGIFLCEGGWKREASENRHYGMSQGKYAEYSDEEMTFYIIQKTNTAVLISLGCLIRSSLADQQFSVFHFLSSYD